MSELKKLFVSLYKDESGATAVEYGLMLFMITVALVIAITALSGRLVEIFNETTAALGG